MAQTIDKRFLGRSASGIGFTNDQVDVSVGGQMGYATDQRYWVNSANYIPRPGIGILLQAPRFYEYMNDPAKRRELLRSIVENHPTRVDGINGKLSVAMDSSPFGAAGEIQEEVVNVTREPSKPSMTFFDKYGRALGNFWEDHIRTGMMDEETKIAGIHMIEGNRPEDALPDLFTFSMLYMEPDPTHRKVVKAVILTNMMPTDGPDWNIVIDKTSNMQLQQMTIPFSAIASHGSGIRQVAQSVLDGISITNANPLQRASFIKEIAPDVLAAAAGYAHHVKTVQSETVRLG